MSRAWRVESVASLCALLFLTCACSDKKDSSQSLSMALPDWHNFQAKSRSDTAAMIASSAYNVSKPGVVTSEDVKHEPDSSLARRLLGDVGRRVAYVERHRERWEYDTNSLDLYTRPEALGSQYGLCGVERYSLELRDDRKVASVEASRRFGVEGPVLQRKDFDWDYYYDHMCASAPPSHAPSYFPAPDVSAALDVARLMLLVSTLAKAGPNSLTLECISKGESKPCGGEIKGYLARLTLDRVNKYSEIGCPIDRAGPRQVCFTIDVDEHRLGPFPKHITVFGSTYMNDFKVFRVNVREDFTMS